jgi:hypothetical protein
MEHGRTFGRRRTGLEASPALVAAQPALRIPPISAARYHTTSSQELSATVTSAEDEIGAWTSARRFFVRFPWRQFSLMAGLCFGLASFVLPSSVNDAVAWPLYVLSALGFLAGMRKRKPV